MGYSLLSQDSFADDDVETHTVFLGKRNTKHLKLPGIKLQSLFKRMIIVGLYSRALDENVKEVVGCGMFSQCLLCTFRVIS